MKVVKNSARRTVSWASYVGESSQLDVPRVSALRVRGSRLAQNRFTEKKTVRLKGGCKKRRFRDLEEALEALHQIERFRYFVGESEMADSGRRENRAYKCPACRGAHLTSKPQLSELVMNVA
jgi:hypothetical protein